MIRRAADLHVSLIPLLHHRWIDSSYMYVLHIFDRTVYSLSGRDGHAESGRASANRLSGNGSIDNNKTGVVAKIELTDRQTDRVMSDDDSEQKIHNYTVYLAYLSTSGRVCLGR